MDGPTVFSLDPETQGLVSYLKHLLGCNTDAETLRCCIETLYILTLNSMTPEKALCIYLVNTAEVARISWPNAKLMDQHLLGSIPKRTVSIRAPITLDKGTAPGNELSKETTPT